MHRSHIVLSLALFSGLFAAACADDDEKETPQAAGSAGKSNPSAGTTSNAAGADTGTDAGEGGAGGSAGSENQPEPLYVVATGVPTGEELVGYLTTVRSIEAGTKINLDNAAEVGSLSWIFTRPGDAAVYVASLWEPTIVRWEANEAGDLKKTETLDLTNLGSSSAYLAASAPVFSETKSYFADEDQDQIVIWNPKTMEYIGTIPLGDEDEGNLRPIPEGSILVRGDKLVVTVGWRDADDTSVQGDHVRVVTIDTKSDEIIDSKVEDRAGHEGLNAMGSDGTAYFSPLSMYAAETQIGEGHGSASVVLRMLPGETSFDPDFSLDLSQLVGGRPAGDATLLDDQTALIRVWHPEIVDEIDPEKWQDVIWGQAGFKWWKWSLGDTQAVEIEDQEPGAQGATVFKIDGKTFTTRYAEDLSKTDLIEITPDGKLVPTFSTIGALAGPGVIRIR